MQFWFFPLDLIISFWLWEGKINANQIIIEYLLLFLGAQLLAYQLSLLIHSRILGIYNILTNFFGCFKIPTIALGKKKSNRDFGQSAKNLHFILQLAGKQSNQSSISGVIHLFIKLCRDFRRNSFKFK